MKAVNRKFTLQCNPLTKSSSYYHPATQESSSKVSSLCFHRHCLLRLQPASCRRRKVSRSEQMYVCVCVCTRLWNSWRWGQWHCSPLSAGQDAAELVFRLWPAQTGQPQASCSQELDSTYKHIHLARALIGYNKQTTNREREGMRRLELGSDYCLGKNVGILLSSCWHIIFLTELEKCIAGPRSKMALLTSKGRQSLHKQPDNCNLQFISKLQLRYKL